MNNEKKQLAVIKFPYKVNKQQVVEVVDDFQTHLGEGFVVVAMYSDIKEQEVLFTELLSFDQVKKLLEIEGNLKNNNGNTNANK